jgi:hypothetical protein
MPTIAQQTTTLTTHTGAEMGTKVLFSSGNIAGGVWLTAIMSAVLAQMEYRHKRDELKELYKEELSAQLGKPSDKIVTEDFDRLAATNHTFGEELAKAKKERNLGVGVIAVSTLGAVGAALGIMSLLTPVGAAAAGFSITNWLATTAVAMMAYGVIKYPMQKLGEKIFGVEKKTTHERIEEMYKDHQAGKVISRERVFEVFVHANPPLDAFIEQKYGKPFDKLKPVDKLYLADTIGKKLGVEPIAEAINKGKIRSTELAFTVDGKFSGVVPTTGDKPKHTLVENVKEKFHHAAEVVTGHSHPADNRPEGFSFARREEQRRAAAAEVQR